MGPLHRGITSIGRRWEDHLHAYACDLEVLVQGHILLKLAVLTTLRQSNRAAGNFGILASKVRHCIGYVIRDTASLEQEHFRVLLASVGHRRSLLLASKLPAFPHGSSSSTVGALTLEVPLFHLITKCRSRCP